MTHTHTHIHIQNTNTHYTCTHTYTHTHTPPSAPTGMRLISCAVCVCVCVCRWISQPDKWGGAIELSILCRHYGREIAAYDIQTCRCDVYGQDAGGCGQTRHMFTHHTHTHTHTHIYAHVGTCFARVEVGHGVANKFLNRTTLTVAWC